MGPIRTDCTATDENEDDVSIGAARRFVCDVEYWVKQRTGRVDGTVTSEWRTARYCAPRRKVCLAIDVF